MKYDSLRSTLSESKRRRFSCDNGKNIAIVALVWVGGKKSFCGEENWARDWRYCDAIWIDVCKLNYQGNFHLESLTQSFTLAIGKSNLKSRVELSHFSLALFTASCITLKYLSLKNSECESIVQWTRNEEEAVVGEERMRICVIALDGALVLHHTSSAATWRRKQNVLGELRKFTSSYATRISICFTPFVWTLLSERPLWLWERKGGGEKPQRHKLINIEPQRRKLWSKITTRSQHGFLWKTFTRFFVCEVGWASVYLSRIHIQPEAEKEKSTTWSERYSHTTSYNVWNHFQFHL